jgi:hypothetical protein
VLAGQTGCSRNGRPDLRQADGIPAWAPCRPDRVTTYGVVALLDDSSNCGTSLDKHTLPRYARSGDAAFHHRRAARSQHARVRRSVQTPEQHILVCRVSKINDFVQRRVLPLHDEPLRVLGRSPRHALDASCDGWATWSRRAAAVSTSSWPGFTPLAGVCARPRPSDLIRAGSLPKGLAWSGPLVLSRQRLRSQRFLWTTGNRFAPCRSRGGE